LALTREPDNEGENQDMSMETAFTLSLAGYIAVPSPRGELRWDYPPPKF